MRRSMIPTMVLTLALGLALALPVGAMASPLVSSTYERIDAKIDNAFTAGTLTRGERNTLLRMIDGTEQMIRDARRDGRITGGERARIRDAADDVVDTFYRYRDNRAVRFGVVHVPAPQVVWSVHLVDTHRHVTHHTVTHHVDSRRGDRHHRSRSSRGSNSHRR